MKYLLTTGVDNKFSAVITVIITICAASTAACPVASAALKFIIYVLPKSENHESHVSASCLFGSAELLFAI